MAANWDLGLLVLLYDDRSICVCMWVGEGQALGGFKRWGRVAKLQGLDGG